MHTLEVKILTLGNTTECTKDLIENTRNLKITSERIQFEGNTIHYSKVAEKELYYACCLYPVLKPKCIGTWNRILQMNLEIDDVFVDKFHPLYHRKSFEFHLKILHRAVYSEMRLKQMNKSNCKCKLCNIENETIIHLLHDCECIKNVWNEIQTIVNEHTELNV